MPIYKDEERIPRRSELRKKKSSSCFWPWVKIAFVAVVIYVLGAGFLKFSKIFADQKPVVAAKKYTKPQVVCLDPGHGGDDTGATYYALTERDINLEVADKVQTTLENDGYKVVMTRTSNTPYLTNSDRVNFCNANHASVLVAIHQNDFTDPGTDYSIALYYNSNAVGLAASLANSASSELGVTNDGIATFDDGELVRAQMPAALVESLFITNQTEYDDLTSGSSARIDQEATGITNGILNYFKNPNQQPSQTQVLNQADPDNMP